MSETHGQFVGSIPEHYDEHLGPLLFHFYAEDLAGRVAVPAGGRVLEIACGTAISTEFLRRALADDVEIVATDLNQAMLDHAMAKCGDMANVRFRRADALDLPFEDASFDVVACQFGLMFFPDKAAGLREFLRVLKPGGQLALNVWDSHDVNTIARAAHQTVGSFFASDPPTFMLVPFSLHDRGALRAMIEDAGFAGVDVADVSTVAERPSARHVAVGLIEGNPNILEIRERATVEPEVVIDALAARLVEEFGDAPLRAPLRAIVATARRPLTG